MNKREYWDRLDAHDWHYRLSNDYSVRNKERAEEKELLDIANKSPKCRKLYDAYNAYMNNNLTEPKPERPK